MDHPETKSPGSSIRLSVLPLAAPTMATPIPYGTPQTSFFGHKDKVSWDGGHEGCPS